MKLLLFFTLTLFCNPGTILDHENNKKFVLQCNEPECFYTLELQNGVYFYINETKTDTVKFIVTNNSEIFLLKKQKINFFYFKQYIKI